MSIAKQIIKQISDEDYNDIEDVLDDLDIEDDYTYNTTKKGFDLYLFSDNSMIEVDNNMFMKVV